MNWCCLAMQSHVEYRCAQHGQDYCPDRLVERRDVTAYYLTIRDGGSAGCRIWFCPWCGTLVDPVGARSSAMTRDLGRRGEE